MRRYMIISHGRFAQGAQDTLRLFMGERCPYEVICAYIDDVSAEDKLAEYMAQVEQEDELIVCSDLMGGSVNQLVMPLLKRSKTFVVAGVNLPVLMELAAMEPDEPLTEDSVRDVVELCRKSTMVFMNDKYKAIAAADGDE